MMSSQLGSGSSMFGSGVTSPTGTEGFPDPFQDMASLAMPETMSYALQWCQYIAISNGTYLRALDRVLSYMITDIEISAVRDDREKTKIKEYLYDNGILDELHTAGLDYMVYGNRFTSALVPFRRYLSCPRCRLNLPFRTVTTSPDFNYRWSNYEFNADCPKCKFSGAWNPIDRRDANSSPIKLKAWSPHEIELLWNPFNEDVRFIWKIPEDYRRVIREGQLFQLETAPWEIIQAVKNNMHFKFDKDVVYHMKENTFAGIRNRGWGISRVLSHFRQAWYVQVLRRYNEAIALDYVIPFRVITPAPGPGSNDQARDALMNLNMGSYTAQIQRMLRQRRRDPASWHTLPFPVQYQALGGDARELAPRDLLDQGLEILLNDVGVPVELYKGSLQIQSAPAALRLFESSWSHLYHSLNKFLAFVSRQLSVAMGWEHASIKLRKVTHADDIQRSLGKLQLMGAGAISKQTGLDAVGADYFEEIRRQMEEQKFEAKEQEKLIKDLQQSALAGQMAQGGMLPAGMPPPVPGAAPGGAMSVSGGPQTPGTQVAGNVAAAQPTIMQQPQTPQEMYSRAQTLAQQILTMPEAQKDSELIQLSKTDPLMHTLVKDWIEKQRRQAQVAGGAMLMQQQFGKAGSTNGNGYIEF